MAQIARQSLEAIGLLWNYDDLTFKEVEDQENWLINMRMKLGAIWLNSAQDILWMKIQGVCRFFYTP